MVPAHVVNDYEICNISPFGFNWLYFGGIVQMNYGKIKCPDVANGEGLRVSVFVSGCRNHCKGCFNPETWGFDYGEPFTEETEDYIIKLMESDYIRGLSILGGDPLEPENEPVVQKLCEKVKEIYPNKTIWLYTGYLWENTAYHPIIKFVDVLVDGKFIEELKNPKLRFRGSENQRIIDVQKSRGTGDIYLWEDSKDYE